MSDVKCTRCQKLKDKALFVNAHGRTLKMCTTCRERSRLLQNRERSRLYQQTKRSCLHTSADFHAIWNEAKNVHSFTSNRPERIDHEIHDGVDGKKCSICDAWQPIINFHKFGRSHDGYVARCKNCTKAYKHNHIARWREYQRTRRQTNPTAKLAVTLRNRMSDAIRRAKASKKSDQTLKLVGCTWTELQNHISAQFQPGMTWENHGEWHIDHIRPCASFDLTKEDEQRACFNFTNLQPLWAHENLSKGAKY